MSRLTIGTLMLALLAGFPVAADAVLAREVERRATVVAVAQVPAPDRFEVIASRFSGAPSVEGDVVLTPLEVTGPNAAGHVRVVFRMQVDGVPRGEARATVRGRVFGPVLQAAVTLAAGRPLTPQDLIVADVELTRLVEPPLREPAQALGLVPVRTLGRGRIMTGSLVEPAPVVFRGQRVDLRSDRHALNLVVSAVAKRDGAPGDVIPFENTTSGVTLHGRVLADGTAEFVRR